MENDEGETLTVKFWAIWPYDDRFESQIEDFNLDHLRFQQDSTTSHTKLPILALLVDKFRGRVTYFAIWRCNWYPRSCDLTPVDFVGYAKDHVYVDNSRNSKALKKANIRF